MEKSNHAITLIALIITIIILVILAAVSIRAVYNMGIVNHAINGTAEYAKAAKNENKVMQDTESYLEDAISKIKSAQDGETVSGGDSSSGEGGNPEGLVGLTSIEEEKLPSGVTEIAYDSIENENLKNADKIKAVITGNVPIPINATYEEGTVDTGVVIKYKNSEFVWIPVPDAIYDSTKDGMLPKSKTTGSLTTGHNYTPMAINTGTEENPIYKGLLYEYYNVNGAFLLYPNASQYQGSTSGFREPAYLTDRDNNSQYNTIGITEDGLQQSYNSMIESVDKYGGFFVGRYETSINDITGKAQSIANVRPSNAKDTATNKWYGLYKKQEEFTENEDKMQSCMIWGSQYDAMLNWAVKGDDKAKVKSGANASSDDTYDDTTIRTRATTENDTITGLDRINNIYDLEGNLYEWTQGAYDSKDRNYRGGNYGDGGDVPPYFLCYDYPEMNVEYYGSRLTLYIK